MNKKPKSKRMPAGPARAGQSAGGLPSREELLRFMAEADGKVGKREIARAFGIRGDDRTELKRLLAELSREGAISGNRKALKKRGGLPAVAVLEVVTRDAEGDLIAEPATWNEPGERPRARIQPHDTVRTVLPSDLGIGDRILARITPIEADNGNVSEAEDAEAQPIQYLAEPIRKLPREKARLLGIYREDRKGGGGHVLPIDRKQLRDWKVEASEDGNAADGDLVRFDIAVRGRHAAPGARIVESLGNPKDQRKISLIAIHAHGLPETFPDAVEREAHELPEAGPGGRTDLTGVPLLTIDPSDARDHDDAVHATPDTDPGNPGGHIVTVAIADVAQYVRPGTQIDREALLRANSVYFPDRVVPMLPERLSTDLCSLLEKQDRPCLAVRMVFDANGKKKRHTFVRGVMRSAAKLSYEEAQRAFDGNPSAKCKPLMDDALKPLWIAYVALKAAREDRSPLDLDLPERRVLLDAEGRVDRIVVPKRLEAHRLIEEMMIQANVAAAETLESQKSPVIYRVHEPPSKEKLTQLRDFLGTIGMKVPVAGQLRPSDFNRVLAAAKGQPVAELVNEVVLRSQSQADYRPLNAGHFGLHLFRYAHFTSPIRRYADLIVHRSLIQALKMGEGGLGEDGAKGLEKISKQISEAERRAMAERETVDRLVASHLSDRIGAEFQARISGVTRSGLFVKLKDTGADGFVPISTLGADYFAHVEVAHALVGTRTGLGYRLGDIVTVKLVEAIPTAGALRFEMVTEGRKGLSVLAKSHAGGGGGGRSRRHPKPKTRRY
jgi:ribonuclease R